jgi:hypothetical protein
MGFRFCSGAFRTHPRQPPALNEERGFRVMIIRRCRITSESSPEGNRGIGASCRISPKA